MPKSENQKLKILYVAKYLLENSDENNYVRTVDIVDHLVTECDISAERRSIYRDINILRDVFGMDIVNGHKNKYKLMSRQFEFDDACLLYSAPVVVPCYAASERIFFQLFAAFIWEQVFIIFSAAHAHIFSND